MALPLGTGHLHLGLLPLPANSPCPACQQPSWMSATSWCRDRHTCMQRLVRTAADLMSSELVMLIKYAYPHFAL